MKRGQVPLEQIREPAAANASQIPYILGQKVKVRINKENHKGKGMAERRGRTPFHNPLHSVMISSGLTYPPSPLSSDGRPD